MLHIDVTKDITPICSKEYLEERTTGSSEDTAPPTKLFIEKIKTSCSNQ
ncbi:hypothetical protein VCHA48O429_70042 [Vibrio chagasii]|nr:hypothetical protein VCHA32P90_80173 [Vibrio chagasii]CAH7361815.1 hypothetical protein VCHA53O469_70173 [Vibrio chagasii]CAH7378130.1 hypothetical protein VCHA39P230_80045 [Vibrio chagasii]CAH7470626.1 hypothetical protein VCHA48O429_70042 [Vibrio chagasii]CAH7471097.1 hypothetical protein VCHA55O506_80045 [Vibrio chagasii]